MALAAVCGGQSSSEHFGQLFSGKQARLFDRPNHFSFGTKIQEFAVPVGNEVCISLPKYFTLENTNIVT